MSVLSRDGRDAGRRSARPVPCRARRVLLLAPLLSFLLAACVPFAVTRDPVRAVPALSPGALVARDGTKLPLRVWRSAGKPRAVILALHGFNDYSAAFAAPAGFFARRGITTYAYDQRGFGAAPDRGFWPGSLALEHDLEDAVAAVHRRYPETPLYLLGESMGSAVILATLGQRERAGKPPLPIAGVVLGAPAVWGGPALNPFYHAILWLAAHVLPAKTVTGEGRGILASDNIPMLRALGRDPLVLKRTRIGTLDGLVDLMGQALADGSRLRVRALILIGAYDEIVPRQAERRLLDSMPGPYELAYYPDGWHMVFRDLDGPLVWRDVLSWIEDPGAPLPSGYERRALPASDALGATGEGAPEAARGG